jgi:hypothetical protein
MKARSGIQAKDGLRNSLPSNVQSPKTAGPVNSAEIMNAAAPWSTNGAEIMHKGSGG